MACKPKPRASICAFVLEMKGYFDRLESMNMVFDAELSINIILSGMPADYNQFMLSYQMNEKETSIMKLHSLLQTAKQGIKIIDVPSTSAAPVLTVGHNAKKKKTSHSNWKGKAAKGKSDKRKAESEIAPTSDPNETVCFYCNTKGNWKRSWPKYLKDLKDRKVEKDSHSESRRLKHGELNLVMGIRKIMPVIRIGKYELMLKSGDGYKFSFYNENGDILVYSNGCFMFKASPCKGIYETVECISHNGNVILNVGSSNKLDKSKLWHSYLGHVNKKRITQLQKDGVLESFDFKSDDVCESCLLGKMTKSPFIGSCERCEGLLDLVHTDLCGPFPYATKDGKRYYVTFTDDFSRYGYVYLIKHKSDTFEVFKRYQNEVENQLGRKIKMWKGKRPFLGHIKIWGCEVFIRREAQDKLEAISKKCLFVGYPEEPFGYSFYKPKDNVVFVAQRGVFLEREIISKEESGINDSTLSELDEPANYKEAMASPEAAK
ncbi:retrotransposon protein, putative, ty1-copia subclass [Tanacetum coccineum]